MDRLRLGKKKWVFVSAYGQREKEEKKYTFWKDLKECLKGFRMNYKILLLEDLDAELVT